MNGSHRSRVPQLRIAESVAAELRSRILATDADGDFRLPTQDQLVAEFQVSYPSVREAIRILETEGLVTVRRGNVGGAEVHRPNESTAGYALGLALQGARVSLRDLAEGILILEPMSSAACAKRADRMEDVVPTLADNIEKCVSVIDDGVAFTHTAREFHEIIVASTPNSTIRYVVRSLVVLWSAQEESWAESMTRRGDYFSEQAAKEVVRIHRRILKEITTGRPAEAERISRAHLAATQEAFLSRFDDDIVDATSLRARQAINSIRSLKV